MEKIISYDSIPAAKGQSIYLRMEEDPSLYFSLFRKGYRIVNKINQADESTIYVTGQRQIREHMTTEEYQTAFNKAFMSQFQERDIVKPITRKFSYSDLIDGKYKLPFVFKNEKAHGGTEKFLIATEQDYENLIRACNKLFTIELLKQIRKPEILTGADYVDMPESLKLEKTHADFVVGDYSVQEFVRTPTKYCTSVRLLTSSSNDLLCGILKYNLPEDEKGNESFLGYLLRQVYPLSTKSIQSNTLRGGNNIVIDGEGCSREEREILDAHNLTSEQFQNVVETSRQVHSQFKRELGILCGFDYIYDQSKEKWYMLEYHSKPMVGDYAVFNGLPYKSKMDRIESDGLVRGTALSLALKKQR